MALSIMILGTFQNSISIFCFPIIFIGPCIIEVIEVGDESPAKLLLVRPEYFFFFNFKTNSFLGTLNSKRSSIFLGPLGIVSLEFLKFHLSLAKSMTHMDKAGY